MRADGNFKRDIEVRFESAARPSGPEIARSAAAAIKLQLPLAWQNVKALVDEGRLTLEGEVPWNYQRVRAECAVRALLGVRSVSNQIKIKPPVAPCEIKHCIEDAFRRSAQVDANRITVEANGGEITLKGKVRSSAEREAAQETAWSVPGVMTVRNQIAVRA
jgi:osmotically-inducible protein OsmY